MLIKLLAALLALIFTKASSLEHEKSFLLQNGATFVYSIAFYRDSLLITSSNDIIQKDIETGAIQRTFRAHTNQIQSFLVVEDTRMITSAWDDMIILWDLESGSVMKRIWLRAQRTSVNCLAFLDNQLFAAGFDFTVRRIDLVDAKVTTVIRKT